MHLGAGASLKKCRANVYYIGSSKEEIKTYPEKLSFFALAKNFFCSFSSAHCHQTTLEKFSYKKVTSDEVQEILV